MNEIGKKREYFKVMLNELEMSLLSLPRNITQTLSATLPLYFL